MAVDDQTQETILIVDDEDSILDVSRQFFQFNGYNVMTAKNGVEALSVLRREKIDCCFTDINMPEMDGLELAEHIRHIDNSIPVIIMTAYPSIETSIRTLKNGVVDYLIKPVNLNHMEACIKRVLRERTLFVENIMLKKEVESNAKLEKINRELIEKITELDLLNKIMSDFNMISSSSQVFKRTVDLTIELTHADESKFFVISEAAERPFEINASYAGSTSSLRPSDLGLSPSPPSKKTTADSQLKKPLQQLIMEVASDKIPMLIKENKGSLYLDKDTLSFMAAPLNIRDKVFGVLTATVKTGDLRFNEKNLYYLTFITQNASRAVENLALYENIFENLFSTLYAFVKAIEARDPYTEQHSSRVTEIALAIAGHLRLSKEELDILNSAGRLHDIGKIGIRDDILLKPDRLTDEEFMKIKEHPVIGANIVSQLGLWHREQQIIRWHHERYDGTGYPDGLKGDEIPLLARILSVADAYDAMASDRAYRKKMEINKVLDIIKNGSGTQFAPNVVDLFLTLHRQHKIPMSEEGS